ncbi:MAG TPA: phage holin family protein [Pyrinomonadaceae bacterium]
MADLERTTAAAPARSVEVQAADVQELPALFGRLSDGVMTLLDTKLSLLKVEIKEDAEAYVRGGTMIGVGGVIAGVGFALLNVAVAFFVAKLFTFADPRLNYALGFLITGALYLLIGGIIVLSVKNRLAKRNLVPSRSVEELKRDREWIQKG